MAMRVVMQSVERASLLVDNVDKWVEIGRGLVVYVCFLKEAHEDAVKKAAHDVLHCKIFPHVDEACQRHRPAAALGENWDIMVVPQATLGGKLKGKQAQYHGQCEKAKGEELYQLFCGSLAEGIAAHDRGDASAPTFAAGTYGNRQGLKFESLGPFSHHVEYQCTGGGRMGWMPQDLHLHQHALEPDIPEEIQGSVSPAYGSLDGQNTIRRLLHAGATAHGVWAGVVERMKGRVVLSEDHIVDEIDVKTIVVELLKERVAKTRAAAKQWLRFWRRRRRARERSASASTRGVSPTATFREEMIPEHLPAGDLFAREDTPSEIPEELGANPQLLSTYRTDRTATTDIMDPYTPLTPTRGPVPHEVPVPVSPLRILIPKRREGAKASCTPYVPIDQANPPLPSVIVPRKQPQFPAGQAARRPVSGQGQRGGGATEVSSSCVLTEGAQSPAAVGRLRRLVRGGRPGDDAWLGSGTATPASSSGDMSPARSLSPSPAGRTVPQGRGPVAPVEGKVKVPGEEELEFLALLKEPEDPLQGVRLPASLSPSPGDKPGSRPLTPPSSTPAGRGRAPSADDLEFMTWCQGVQGPGVGHAAKTGPLKHNSTGSHAAPRKPRGHQRKTSSSSLPEAGPMEKRQPRGYCSPTPPVAGAPQIARSNYAGTPPPPARGGTKSSPPKPMRRPSDSADQLSLERRNSGVIKPKPDRGAMVMPKIAPVNNHAERRHFPARASSSKLFG